MSLYALLRLGQLGLLLSEFSQAWVFFSMDPVVIRELIANSSEVSMLFNVPFKNKDGHRKLRL